MPSQSKLPLLIRLSLCIALLLATWPSGLAAVPPTGVRTAQAQEREPVADEWHSESTAQGASVTWQPTTQPRTDKATWRDWPLVTIAGRQQPAHLLTFAATDSTPPQLRLDTVTSRAWLGRTLPGQPVTPAIPQPLGQPPRPDLALAVEDSLPAAPAIELRRGRMAGVELLVVAVSPLFGDTQSPRELTSLRLTVTGGRLLEPAGRLPGVDRMILDEPAPPSPLTARPRLRVSVREAGMQEIPLSALTEVGLISNPSQLARLQLTRQGAAVAVEIVDNLLRFYAPAPGDRWNREDSYWLTLGSSAGTRIVSRPLVSDEIDTLSPQQWAWEIGKWSSPVLYDSTLAGQDGDHWFAFDLRSGAELPVITHTLPISSLLPPLSASAAVTLHVSGYTKHSHQLRISPPGYTATLLAWEGSGARSLSFAVDSRGQNLALATVEKTVPDGVMIDSMEWRRPVALRFGFGDGSFVNGPEESLLQLEQVAAASRLYDISDPHQPVRITLPAPSGGTLLLESAPHRRFLLLADESRLHLPLISAGPNTKIRLAEESQLPAGEAHTDAPAPDLALLPALNFQPFLNADALYIAPALFHTALQPLLDQRASQGYRVALVDVDQIYEGWRGGQVDPAAIRDFVRWRTANGEQPPQAIVLVGDATSDPLNFTRQGNTNFIPPYLLHVDPWLIETACDSCFGQVDGLSPLDDPLPDIPVGRIPAKSAAEVTFYVEKLLGYERTPAPVDQRARMVFVADNYRDASGRVDPAGDFALATETAVALQPASAQIERVYFDPSPTHSQNPWREPDPVRAWQKTVEALNRGGGFASYTGHAHQQQWASTDLNVEPPYLLGLYDADGLTNQSNLSILLEMTCLTGMFQMPALSGTTIDERLLLHTKGGAAAIWSSTGLGVAYGHDALQRGFYSHFWSQTASDKRLGALAQAGYRTLFSEGVCCQESLRTFVILGDPLTVPQAAVERQLWLPMLGR